MVDETFRKRLVENTENYVAFAPVSSDVIAKAEQHLGFRLPASLTEIYTRVGNGGFGPSYGLLGLVGGAVNESGEDAVSLYERFRKLDPDDPHWRWPEGLLPVGHLGCAMYACVDCTSERGPVIWFEPNPHTDGESWDDSFFRLADSMTAWLEAWLDGGDDELFEAASPLDNSNK